MDQVRLLGCNTLTVKGAVSANVVPERPVSARRFEHQRVRRRRAAHTADALTVQPGFAQHMDEARSELVVSDVADQLYGRAERVQITTRVRNAPAGQDRQGSDVDDRSRDDLFLASKLRIQVGADVAGHDSS